MRVEPILSRVLPPRIAFHAMFRATVKDLERIIRIERLRRNLRDLRLCRPALRGTLSYSILTTYGRWPAIRCPHTARIVRRDGRSRLTLLGIADRRIHRPRMPLPDHDNKVRSHGAAHNLKPSPLHQRRFNVPLGHQVCLRIFRIDVCARGNNHHHRVGLQNIRRQRLVLSLRQHRRCHHQTRRHQHRKPSPHPVLLTSAQILRRSHRTKMTISATRLPRKPGSTEHT
jgi:hypothetical protein